MGSKPRHDGHWSRYEIDRVRFQNEIMKTGKSKYEISKELGYVPTYLHTCCYQGEMSAIMVEKLKKHYGIEPETYILKKPGRLRAMAQKPVDPWEDKPSERPEHCKTCIFRGGPHADIGCEYMLMTGHRRGCKAENCDKYVKGNRAQPKDPIRLPGSAARKKNRALTDAKKNHVFIWLFAAFDRTPEERRQDDEDQMEWMREYENNRKASRWTGQKRKRDT